MNRPDMRPVDFMPTDQLPARMEELRREKK
jgi:hypothetical protein